MPRTAQTLALLFVLALAGCATRAPTSAVEEVALTHEDGLSAVNAFRTRNGLRPVTVSEPLMQAAAFQSEAMARRDTLGHAVAGALPGRVERFGYRWSTTAEGIETEAQLDQLRLEGCDEGQGYLFSRPVPSAAIRELVTALGRNAA